MIRAVLIAVALIASGILSAQAQSFGAIAYSSSTTAYGQAWGYSNRQGAERRALAECRNYGGGCRVAVWFRDACGALALGQNGGWGSGWGNTRRRARQEAMASCRSYGNRGCNVRLLFCSDG